MFNLLLAGLLVASLPAQAKLYKWVDGTGRVYYTDTPPPQSSRHAVTELGKTGQAMRRTESIEERQARLAEERRLAEETKIANEVARKDRALLATYTKESEIDLARDRALEHHRLAINGARARMDQVSIKAKDVLSKVQVIKSRGRPVPPFLKNQLDATFKESADLTKLIAQHEAALVTVGARYEADKARFRELTAKN